MRRLISISTAVALLISLASPLLAEACMKNSDRASCHRASRTAPHHHCDGMPAHHHEDDMSIPDQGDFVNNVSSTCPMNCCLAARAGKHAAAVHNIGSAPQL